MHQFKVTGMTCAHCVQTITQSVKAVDNAAQVEADTATGQVQVKSELRAEPLAQAINDAGYTVVRTD